MSATTAEGAKGQSKGFAALQRFGRSLMLPIAALPAAGLLARLGQDDLLGPDGLGWNKVAAVLGAAGGGLFDWLPLLFAVGIAVGFARKGDGSTGVAAVVGWVVFNNVIQVFAPIKDMEGFKEGWLSAPIKWPYSVLTGVIVAAVATFVPLTALAELVNIGTLFAFVLSDMFIM